MLGLESIRNIHLDAYFLRSNLTNLVNLKNSIQFGIKMFRSVDIVYSDLEQKVSNLEIDCISTIYMARFNIQLNLKNETGFESFFNLCKEFFGHRFFIILQISIKNQLYKILS
jgi:hypothetical protein